MKLTKLIIIDEMTMLHSYIFEAIVDRTLREATGLDNQFGSITPVFAGDWRQCLPIINPIGPGGGCTTPPSGRFFENLLYRLISQFRD
jgi:hypothetical protein